MMNVRLRLFCCTAWVTALLPLIRPECKLDYPRRAVRCVSTSINDYVYDVLQADAYDYESLDISHSYFPKIQERLILPVPSIRTLKIAFSNVSSVAPDFLSGTSIQVLDLGHNELETFSLSDSCCYSLEVLDLSHNKLRAFDFAMLPMIQNFHLNLGFNSIEEINCAEYCNQFWTLNLEHNPINVIHSGTTGGCPKWEGDTLILSGVNLTLPLLHSIARDFQVGRLNMSGASVPSDAVFDYPVYVLDLSHSSIRFIGHVLGENMAGRARYLNLSHNSIETTELGDFQSPSINVEVLDLSFNRLRLTNGSFGQWRALSELRLVNCSLEAVGDEMFGGLDSLRLLDLSGNLLHSLVANSFRTLPSLQRLILSRNLITRLGEETFAGLSQLEIVDASENAIRLIETKAFVHLPRLRIVRIARNNASLSLRDDAFQRLPDLIEHLDLSGSDVEPVNQSAHSLGPRYVRFPECPFVELSLTLCGNLGALSFECDRLDTLSIVDAAIPVLGNDSFRNFDRLRVLRIDGCTVDDVEPAALRGLFDLARFDVKCIFARTRSIRSLAFKDLRRLPELDLSAIGLRIVQSRAFFGMERLERLNLSNNNLTRLGADIFEGLSHLRHLQLENSSIRYCSARAFYGLERLDTLSLAGNKMQTIELGTFQHFPSLRVLNISRNKLVEFKVGVFSNLPGLQELYLAHNDISTILTESLWPLQHLKLIDLEYNNLKRLDYQVLTHQGHFYALDTLKIAKNKFRCDYLKDMMVAVGSKISQSSHVDYFSDNINGVDCVDVCKYVLCLKDSHGIN